MHISDDYLNLGGLYGALFIDTPAPPEKPQPVAEPDPLRLVVSIIPSMETPASDWRVLMPELEERFLALRWTSDDSTLIVHLSDKTSRPRLDQLLARHGYKIKHEFEL